MSKSEKSSGSSQLHVKGLEGRISKVGWQKKIKKIKHSLSGKVKIARKIAGLI